MARQVEHDDIAGALEAEGYAPWYNAIDADVAHEATCDECGQRGLRFKGFQGSGERHAIAICQGCGYQFEF